MNGLDLSKMDVVILCGGKGERFQAVDKDRPKPMADIGGRPFLDILIKSLERYKFCRFILCAGYKGEIIRDYYNARSGASEVITLIEDKPLGTAGAIKKAESIIKGNHFLVLNGDSFCSINYHDFIGFYHKKRSLCSIVVVKIDENDDGGLVKLDAEHRIVGFNEKLKTASGDYLSAGIYIFDRKIFEIIEPENNLSLEYDIFPRLDRERFHGYILDSKVMDIGTPDRYVKAREFFKKYHLNRRVSDD